MAISLASLQTSSTLRPPRILMHGVHGVGKTTFAAGADAPVGAQEKDEEPRIGPGWVTGLSGGPVAVRE